MGASASAGSQPLGRERNAHRRPRDPRRNPADLSTAVELLPGVFVNEDDVRRLISLVADRNGRITVPRLKTYLEQEGLPASTEECEEMLRMLVPMPPDDSLGTLPAADSSVASRNDGMSILADDCFTTPEDALAFMEAMNEDISSIMVAEAFHAEMEAEETTAEQNKQKEGQRGLEAQIWSAFLNRCFQVGEAACKDKILDGEAIQQRESFVFLALPALTLLDIVVRTLSSAGVSDGRGESRGNARGPSPTSLSFAPGLHVDAASLAADGADWFPVVASLLELQAALPSAEAADATLRGRLRLALCADPEEGVSFHDATDAAVTRFSGMLQNAATLLTQTDTFRDSFEGVLDLIDTVAISS